MAARHTGGAYRTFSGACSWEAYYEEQRYADQRPNQEERDCRRAITALKRLGYDVTVKRIA